MFKWRVSLSIGMMMQLAGRLDEALEWYTICLSHRAESHEDPEGFDAKSLAMVNTALIYCGDKHFDMQKVMENSREGEHREGPYTQTTILNEYFVPQVNDLMTETKTRHASISSTNFRCALHILDSWTREGLIPARYTVNTDLKGC